MDISPDPLHNRFDGIIPKPKVFRKVHLHSLTFDTCSDLLMIFGSDLGIPDMGVVDDVVHFKIVYGDPGIAHDRLRPVDKGRIQLFGGVFRDMHRGYLADLTA